MTFWEIVRSSVLRTSILLICLSWAREGFRDSLYRKHGALLLEIVRIINDVVGLGIALEPDLSFLGVGSCITSLLGICLARAVWLCVSKAFGRDPSLRDLM